MIIKVIDNFQHILEELFKFDSIFETQVIPISDFSDEFRNEIQQNDLDSIILSPNNHFDADFIIIHKIDNVIRISYIDKNKQIKQYEIENSILSPENINNKA